MTVYHYQSGELLQNTKILTNELGGRRAYLFAAPDAPSDQLRQAKQKLRAIGLKCTPTVHDGSPSLEVRGFSNDQQLLSQLSAAGMMRSVPTSVTPDAADTSKKNKMHGRTLQWAGRSFNIGDVSYLYYKGAPLINSWASESKKGRFFGLLDVIAGVGYGLGSLCLTIFGARDQSINVITGATTKIERFARKEGYNITSESTIAFANKKPERTFFGKINDTIARYPSEALNSIYLFVGMFLSSASLYHATRPLGNLTGEALALAKKARTWDRIDVGLGGVTATSALIGLAVKEHKRPENEPKRSGLGGAIDWIREKPLRATGIGYMIATGFHSVATYGKWKDAVEPKRYLMGRVIFIITNVFSEVMLTLSSKGHGVGVKPDNSVDDSIIAAAAELVMRQPTEKREAMVSQLSGYMASPEVLGVKADVIEKNMRQHIDLLDDNPWTKHFVAVSSAKGQPEAVVKPAMSNIIGSHDAEMSDTPSTRILAADRSASLLQQPAAAIAH